MKSAENIDLNLDENIIDFVNNSGVNSIDNEEFIKSKLDIIINTLIEQENINADKIYVSVESATKEEIQKINKEYRNVDRYTDVLSFPIFSREELEEFKKEDKKGIKEMDLGDIIVCLEVIKEQSEQYDTGLIRELLYMITHGMCHLLGYDHELEDEKVIMRKIEEDVLNKIGVGK